VNETKLLGLVDPIICGWVLMSDPWEELPTDDIGQHVSGMHCACRPEYDDEKEHIIHNAFDHREDFETGRRQHS
jgi:hypothetical protein